ncbi:hypothetical protein M0813_26059 [Anaeramoeba flamelloides]|uniref:Uncharacterized protein n=1 Tax=Anaeramoeba flamelloides TaxID=1746091 RepID=A0ABQ8Y541_9EUKA|nr:hypothetical protein M0813_26059 [Anaeramoeba flamelloides]
MIEILFHFYHFSKCLQKTRAILIRTIPIRDQFSTTNNPTRSQFSKPDQFLKLLPKNQKAFLKTNTHLTTKIQAKHPKIHQQKKELVFLDLLYVIQKTKKKTKKKTKQSNVQQQQQQQHKNKTTERQAFLIRTNQTKDQFLTTNNPTRNQFPKPDQFLKLLPKNQKAFLKTNTHLTTKIQAKHPKIHQQKKELVFLDLLYVIQKTKKENKKENQTKQRSTTTTTTTQKQNNRKTGIFNQNKSNQRSIFDNKQSNQKSISKTRSIFETPPKKSKSIFKDKHSPNNKNTSQTPKNSSTKKRTSIFGSSLRDTKNKKENKKENQTKQRSTTTTTTTPTQKQKNRKTGVFNQSNSNQRSIFDNKQSSQRSIFKSKQTNNRKIFNNKQANSSTKKPKKTSIFDPKKKPVLSSIWDSKKKNVNSDIFSSNKSNTIDPEYIKKMENRSNQEIKQRKVKFYHNLETELRKSKMDEKQPETKNKIFSSNFLQLFNQNEYSKNLNEKDLNAYQSKNFQIQNLPIIPPMEQFI